MKFLDEAKVFIASGQGGAGSVSFRREKFIEYGGPNGGNGGKGGSVFVKAIDTLNTLIDYRYKQHFKGIRGGHGMGQNRTGHDGDSITLNVPVGTQIFHEDKKTLICDMNIKDETKVLLKGGDGGFGNSHYVSSTNRSPRQHTMGFDGADMWIWLRLKLIANVGLIGLPNAGKSTFLSAVTRARPKIASYPFTTLHPGLGVVRIQDEEFIIADLPGLIEGASKGVGLGHKFLGHAERCQVLLHLIDSTTEDVIGAYKTIRNELREYDENDLFNKPEIIALSKTDISEDSSEKKHLLESFAKKPVFTISAASFKGLEQVLYLILQKLKNDLVD